MKARSRRCAQRRNFPKSTQTCRIFSNSTAEVAERPPFSDFPGKVGKGSALKWPEVSRNARNRGGGWLGGAARGALFCSRRLFEFLKALFQLGVFGVAALKREFQLCVQLLNGVDGRPM